MSTRFKKTQTPEIPQKVGVCEEWHSDWDAGGDIDQVLLLDKVPLFLPPRCQFFLISRKARFRLSQHRIAIGAPRMAMLLHLRDVSLCDKTKSRDFTSITK